MILQNGYIQNTVPMLFFHVILTCNNTEICVRNRRSAVTKEKKASRLHFSGLFSAVFFVFFFGDMPVQPTDTHRLTEGLRLLYGGETLLLCTGC